MFPKFCRCGLREIFTFIAIALCSIVSPDGLTAAGRPHVLFIAIDDLNHWLGHLQRNDQAITPNLDRLAARGVSFANAYCAAPACNPSRAALMSGMRPSTTGVYHNPHDYRPHIKPEQTLNSHFRANGYYVAGAGKIYHQGGGRLEDWDDYGERGNVKSEGVYEQEAVGALKWAQLKGGDEVVNDYHTVSYCIDQLNRPQSKPLFLACGIFRPHLPWNVPKKYFDLHPLESIKLPPYQANDLDDLPPSAIKNAGADRDHKNVRKAGAWKRLIRGYLASVSYADKQLGRLLEAFDKSPLSDNTIIVL
ncbi:MAG: sulfatase-like hydrolase/transferase, partial [Verrucomicrobia bacterium]|nr:sulfatase-like hydrolase/transferase [Verrucomicrobiota bacterium]